MGLSRAAQLEVDLKPFQEAFARSDISAHELGRRLGVHSKRAFTLMLHQKRCSYGMAVGLAEALGLDPVDVGI